MSDYNVTKEFNLLTITPQLRTAILNQEACNCCWAICVATVIGYLYYMETSEPDFELSPQDILDRVWLYFNAQVREKARDIAKCYRCEPQLGYAYVKAYGVGFLKNYPFKKKLNDKIDPIDPNTEYPRVFTGDYLKLDGVQEVIHSLKEKKQAVIAAIQVTGSFARYKKEDGIYRHPTAAAAAGDSTKLATIPRGHRELGKHAVVIVGVNEEEEYFIIRNSWGTDWGDEGYGRVAYSAFSSYFTAPSSAFALDYALNPF